MRRISGLAVAVCLLLAIAGCSGPLTDLSDNGQSEGPAAGQGDGTASFGVVDTYMTDFTASDAGYIIEFDVDFRAPMNDSLQPTTFEDVMLCFYDANGTVLNSTRVGDFETPEDEATVTLSSDTKPTYIVADHPRFTSYGETHVRYYMLNDEGRYSSERDPADRLGEAFGYPRHDDVGRCM